MRALERFLRYIDATNDKIGQIICLLLLPLSIITLTEVIARYVFNSPTKWAWDVNLQIFSLVILLSGGYTLLHGRHINVDAIVNRLPPRGRLVMQLIAMLVLMYVAVLLVWQGGIEGWESFIRREKLPTIWAPPIFHIRMLYPIGGLLLLFQGLGKFIRDVLSLLKEGQ